MLLYSTTLEIDRSLTKEDFIRLVIKWNQSSPHTDNVIPGIVWNGERNIRYGNEDTWLAIEEYRNANIIAARFEKRDIDGAVWDTDYIMNFTTMKMTIQLDRVYTEGAQMEDLKFSTPHFITMLIEGGFITPDGSLAVVKEAMVITQENVHLLADVVKGRELYKLPVVYVSKTFNNDLPVNINWLCSKLKGVAHILVQEDKWLNNRIRKLCDNKNEYFGGVGVYFPNGKHKRFGYKNYTGSSNVLMDKIVRSVLQYMNAQQLSALSTWQGVNNSLLKDRYISKSAEKDEAERAREKVETEFDLFVGAFDGENEKFRRQLAEKDDKILSLQLENQGLRGKISEIDEMPILFMGAEDDFYPGEIKQMILDCIASQLAKTDAGTRRADVYKDILQHNDYKGIHKKKEIAVKQVFKGYKTLTSSVLQGLKDLGVEVTDGGKHHRLLYYGDPRYHMTIAKTGSDHREGKNNAARMLKIMM